MVYIKIKKSGELFTVNEFYKIKHNYNNDDVQTIDICRRFTHKINGKRFIKPSILAERPYYK